MDLTPLKAIRKHCLDCMNNQHGLIRICPDKECPSYPYRFGKIPNRESKNILKVIRKQCLYCVKGSKHPLKKIRLCKISHENDWSYRCFLWPYRLGRNPKRIGLGNKNPKLTGKLLESSERKSA